MDRDRKHGAEPDMNGAREEKRGTDIGGEATGITDQDGVVWDECYRVQRWEKVDVVVDLGSWGCLGGDKTCFKVIVRIPRNCIC